jgi:uncharacterized membrane protein
VSHDQDGQGRPEALERMTFFSDAVIAIALTLLALELPVPEADGPRALLRALTGAHGRRYLAFLLAFVLVGASWLAHHALFSYVAGSDDRLLVLNLVALFGFVLVPWASETLGTAAAGGVGLAVFSAVMTVLAASTLALARHVGRGGLLRSGTPRCRAAQGRGPDRGADGDVRPVGPARVRRRGGGRRPVGGGLRRPGRLVGAQEAGGTDELAGATPARVTTGPLATRSMKPSGTPRPALDRVGTIRET